MGKIHLKHFFLYLPQSPVPLPGQDLLTRLKAIVTLAPRQMVIEVLLDQAYALQVVLLQQTTETPAEIPEEIL